MAHSSERSWALVTGGAGFIGSHLAETLLVAGINVVVIDNFNDYYDPAIKLKNSELLREKAKEGQFVLIKADICDSSAIEEVFRTYRFSVVYHLAAMAGVRYSIKHPARYFEVNVSGTVVLLNAIKDHGKPKLVFASSSSVYGGSPNIPFSEKDPVNKPVSPYAASKKAGELVCHTYHHLYGLDISCLRFFTVYGPRQRPEMAVHLFTSKILNGEPVPMFGDGSTSRDYTYIDDIVDGILRAGRNCDGFAIYNLGNNQTVTLAELIATIEQVTEKKAIIRQLPIPPGDVLRTWADLELSAEKLGYSPKTSIQEGIERFYSWYKKVNSKPVISS